MKKIYSFNGMINLTKMKCLDCNEELLAENAELCPYCSSKKLAPIVIKEIDIQKKKAEIKELEKSKQYGKAAKEYKNLGMHEKARNMRKLGIYKAQNLEKEKRFVEAANIYEDLEMWEKAYKCLKAARIPLIGKSKKVN